MDERYVRNGEGKNIGRETVLVSIGVCYYEGWR